MGKVQGNYKAVFSDPLISVIRQKDLPDGISKSSRKYVNKLR